MLYEISPEALASLAGGTTLNDFKTAEQIFRFAKSNGYSETDAAAFCFRYGIRIGRKILPHIYQGLNDKARPPVSADQDPSQAGSADNNVNSDGIKEVE